MLIAYIDEVGEPGAFVSYDHAKFKTSPVFGYAGFVIPEERVHAELLSRSRPFLKLTPQLSEDDRRKLQLIHAQASAPLAHNKRQTHSEKSTYDQ